MRLPLGSVIEARIDPRIYHVPNHNATELSQELAKVNVLNDRAESVAMTIVALEMEFDCSGCHPSRSPAHQHESRTVI